MNCKHGDLAIVVSSLYRPENIGSIVTILRPARPFRGAFCWETTPAKDGWTWARDAALRPLRDNPGQDETLQWLDVPKKVEA